MASAARLRDLTPEQNDRVRTLVRELLRREGESQTTLAPRLGLKQPALSGFMAGRQGTSLSTAKRAADLAGIDVDDLLAGRANEIDPYPNRARALTFVAADAHPDAVAFVKAYEPRSAGQLSALEWLRILLYWDGEARAGRMPR